MKKLFTLLAVLACVSFVACEENEDTTKGNPFLKLSSAANMNYQKAGGEGVIEFLVYRPNEAFNVDVKCDAEWISDVVVADFVAVEKPEDETPGSKDDAYSGAITFNVPVNETGADRSGKFEVTYGNQYFAVNIKQGATDEVTFDYEFELLDYQMTYYDDYAADGIHNYYVMAYIKGPTADGYLQTNDFILQFDIYSSEAPQGAKFIPVGTYTFDADNTFAPGTMSQKYSKCYITSATGVVKSNVSLIDGSITVTENGFEGFIQTADDGALIHFIYSGSTAGGGEMPEPEPTVLSNLTGDVEFMDVNAVEKVTPYGDHFGIGMNVFLGQVLSDSHSMTFQFITPGDAETLEGVYEVVPADGQLDPTKYYFFPGGVSGNNITATWYLNQETGEMGPIVDGTIEIQLWASGITFYDVNVVDDAGNSIKGTFIVAPAAEGSDVEMAVEDGLLVIEDYGDGYEVGMQNYSLTMMEADGEGHALMLDILLPFDSESIAGTYISAFSDESVVMGGTADHLFVPGEYNVYFPTAEGSISGDMLVIEDGQITIEVLENNEYSFTFDCVFETGNTLVGTFKAVDMYAGGEEASAPKALAPAKKMVNVKTSIAPMPVAKEMTKADMGIAQPVKTKSTTFTLAR